MTSLLPFEPDPSWNPSVEIPKIPFIKGKELNVRYYEEAVKPIIQEFFPDVEYSAALIGQCSDVLGFDTPESRDHAWGPRMTIFLSEADRTRKKQYCDEAHANWRRDMLAGKDDDTLCQDCHFIHTPHNLADDIDYVLRKHLPDMCCGYPTSYSAGRDLFGGTMLKRKSGQVNHMITIQTVRGFFHQAINWDIEKPLTALDWLTFPEHYLAFFARTDIYHDGLGTIAPTLKLIACYPDEVWYYIMAAQWARLGVEESYLGRCGKRGDRLGEQFIASRLAYYAMRLCFQMERQYAPFTKWFSSGFAQLRCAAKMTPLMLRLLDSTNYEESEEAYCNLAAELIRMHNNLGITDPMPSEPVDFHGRGMKVIDAHRIRGAILEKIKGGEISKLRGGTGFGLIGAMEQYIDAGAVFAYPARFRELRGLYRS